MATKLGNIIVYYMISEYMRYIFSVFHQYCKQNFPFNDIYSATFEKHNFSGKAHFKFLISKMLQNRLLEKISVYLIASRIL